MKVRVKATGEIVTVIAIDGDWLFCSNDTHYGVESLEGIDDPDYWTRLEHQYAGMTMQGMIKRAYNAYCDDCANYENMIFEDAQALLKDHAEALADVCVEFAHALVQKMKEEKK